MSKIDKWKLDLKDFFKPTTPSYKGNKLPKRLWQKGKSKFVNIRLFEEKLSSINDLERKYQRVEKTKKTLLYRLFQWFKSLFL